MKSFVPEGERFQFGGIMEADADNPDLPGSIEYEPGEEEVLTQLLPEYLSGYFYYVLIESAAAEQAARRNAMKNATDNANEMIENLNRVYEIVGGAAALED